MKIFRGSNESVDNNVFFEGIQYKNGSPVKIDTLHNLINNNEITEDDIIIYDTDYKTYVIKPGNQLEKKNVGLNKFSYACIPYIPKQGEHEGIYDMNIYSQINTNSYIEHHYAYIQRQLESLPFVAVLDAGQFNNSDNFSNIINNYQLYELYNEISEGNSATIDKENFKNIKGMGNVSDPSQRVPDGVLYSGNRYAYWGI